MSATRVHLLLSDDWELRGDGSGNMEALQFQTLRRLCDVYEGEGIRGCFNAEVLQQLVHRRLGAGEPALAALAEEWEAVVREAHGRGHDVQLHLHPQWSAAARRDGHWELSAPWSLAEYPRAAVEEMLRAGKEYLEGLLRDADPAYECVSFRAGSWCIAPSDSALEVLASLGIVFDMSIAAGLYYDSAEVRLDLREVDEPFRPYYPVMSDARRVSERPQPIVCIPTHTHVPRRANRLARALVRRWTRLPSSPPSVLASRHLAPSDVTIPGAGHRRDYSRVSRAPRDPVDRGALIVTDLVNLSYAQMRDALDDIRRRADASPSPLPVILENHTKDIGDFRPLRRFARLLARTPDVEVVTAREIADGIRRGEYSIRTAGGDA
jgi:hypothetical protein